MFSVALDGPAGAGKSTIAKAVAQELALVHVDTGALYRAIGLFAMEKDVATDDPRQVLPLLPQIHIRLSFTPQGQVIFLNDRDVSQEIRTPEASMAASNVSAMPEVREFLMELQRGLARENDVIMDGRDIGTVVLPQADVKIFLTADPEARALRRWKELTAKGCQVEYERVLSEVRERDYNDSHRAAAPLRQAEDAWLADTSHCDLAASVKMITDYIKERRRI